MRTLPILYQDEWLVAVDKPAGMLVHTGRDPEPADQIAMKVIRDQLDCFIHTIHRLDRPTSGVLLFALAKEMQRKMQALFHEGGVEKSYLAVVRGTLPAEGTIEIPLKKNQDAEPRWCKTLYKRLEESPVGISLGRVTPVTGRIHQIRQHLAHIGHPIVGDYLYGEIDYNNQMAEAHGFNRMMLMAQTLSFVHPLSGEPLTVEATVPPLFTGF